MSLPMEISAARLKLKSIRPYLGLLLFSMSEVESPGLKTFGVDRWMRFYYDPEVVKKWSIDEIVGALYHECCHLLRRHHRRSELLFSSYSDKFDKGAFHRLSNQAEDLEINDDITKEYAAIKESGLPDRHKGFIKLPKEALKVTDYQILGVKDGMLFEEIFHILARRRPQPPPIAGSTKRAGQIAENDNHGASRDGAQEAAPASGRCGSCAGGEFEWERGGGSNTESGLTETEVDIVLRRTAKEIISYAKSIGSVPEHMLRSANLILEPQISWHRQLTSCIRNSVAVASGYFDYSWRKNSRRHDQWDRILMPALVAPVPNVAIVCDTSGSMSECDLSAVMGEIKGILRAIGYRDRVAVLSCDSDVHVVQRVFTETQVNLVGGGGTDMGAGIAAASKLRPAPDIIVVLTDGLTPWPPEPPPRSKVIVCIVSDHEDVSCPQWATSIRIKPTRLASAQEELGPI